MGDLFWCGDFAIDLEVFEKKLCKTSEYRRKVEAITLLTSLFHLIEILQTLENLFPTSIINFFSNFLFSFNVIYTNFCKMKRAELIEFPSAKEKQTKKKSWTYSSHLYSEDDYLQSKFI